ncbi:MAG TPA: SRPBCC family protein [bacterium]|nr:SRPBCC family protein [bacterium]
MKRESLSEIIRRPCDEVFDLLHDYERRLDWDPLLREASLLNGASKAAPGVQSLCSGKWSTGGIPMITEYVTFKRGEYAAVKLINKPPFFQSFAATIRHAPVNPGSSQISYIYHFEAKPKWLAWLLEPIMNLRLRSETAKRLRALKEYLER